MKLNLKLIAKGTNQNRVDGDGTSLATSPYEATGGAVGAIQNYGSSQNATQAHENMPPFLVLNFIIYTGIV